jgi:hypothetical protein
MDQILTFLRGWGYVLLAGSFLWAVFQVLAFIVSLLRQSGLNAVVVFIVIGFTVFVSALIYLSF